MSRVHVALVTLLIALGAVATFVALISRSTSELTAQPAAATQPVATARPTTATTAVSTTHAPNAATDSPQADAISSNADVVAQVNERPILMRDLAFAQAVDEAMARLLGAQADAPSNSGVVLERLINLELVQQAADAVAFTLHPETVEQELTAFLTARSKTERDLQDVLAESGIAHAEFVHYFGRMVLVDHFTRAQAATEDAEISSYLHQLQQSARISYGPAAAHIATADAAVVASSVAPAGKTEQVLARIVPNSTVTESHVITPNQTQPTATASTPPNEEERDVNIGALAPLFETRLLDPSDGDAIRFDDLLGAPTVLSFWTTWCPYCRKQTPVLVEASEQAANRTVQFVGINVKENSELVGSYVETHNIGYTIALDEQGEMASAYRVRGFPTTYFLDAEGHIVVRHVGALTPEKIEKYLNQLQSATH